MACNPLANPKGIKHNCELCSKPAFIFCEKCRVTYYCDTEHQNVDWEGIHKRICQLLIPLRTKRFLENSTEVKRKHEKEQQTQRMMQIVELTRNVGMRLLFEEKYEYAIPAVMQSLKFSIDLHGLTSIELAPSYLMLAEACIGLSRLSQATDYLMQAKWNVLKTPSCGDNIKSQLHRNFGLLYVAQGDHEGALHHFAEDIYYSSCAHGTDDVKTSGGYFHMAKIFHKQNKQEISLSLFEQLTSIWHNFLLTSIESSLSVGSQTTCLDEALGAEGLKTLQYILELREDQSSAASSVMMKINFTLAMLYTLLKDFTQANEFYKKALIYAKGSDEKLVLKYQQSLPVLAESL